MGNPMSLLYRWTVLAFLVCVTAAGTLRAAEVIPAKPTRYFNDYALTVRPETADRLNRELEDLEKQTSNQILVAIYPTMQTDSDVADFCKRIFRSWQVGQKNTNNGAVLFVFLDKHKTWIQTGTGIQGVLPDATCKDITADVITPRFKAGDFDGGLTAGVEAMIAATKGEYKGTGQTQYQKEHPGGRTGGGLSFGTILFLILIFFFVSRAFRSRGGGAMYTGGGPIFFPGGGFGGGGGSSSGGGSSDSGGSFSSGGGDTNGGGAGSDW